MDINILFIAFVYLLIIAHSFFSKGLRVTINFFVLSFLCLSLNAEHMITAYSIPLKEGMAPLYIFYSLPTIMVSVAWIIAVYLSWIISEKILSSVIMVKKNIFVFILVSTLVSIILARYCIALATSDIRTQFHSLTSIELSKLNSTAIYNYLLPVVSAGRFFIKYLLIAWATFCIVEFTRFRYSESKSLLVLVPFMHFWFMGLPSAAASSVAMAMRGAVLCAIFWGAVDNPASFELTQIEDQDRHDPEK